ncbi:sterol desaturase family protein [Bradyrhizobium sp. CCBAU 51753]|uniref:sterol desaturase family protein n=1 Tax=Bradyrhizobium sp. CCBAU 51753 TaxID=1325100 RepID=UPI001889F623|nr:sterol desaturase family protein [Bradyrhizobium sp. CCBAU 51753]QOZ28931.1 sterol desaturase family protein [Bradyrhizobium sp. CCBAU 51753]
MAQESSRPRIGEGRIGSSLCAAIGVLSVAAVLCLRYPAFLTTPELRVHYDVELLRLTLAIAMVVGVWLGVIGIMLGGPRAPATIGLSALFFATLLGGPYVPTPDFLQPRFYLGLDWLVLDLFFTGAAFVLLEWVFPRVRPEQGPLSPGWRLDLAYFGVNHLLIGVFLVVSTHFAHDYFAWAISPALQAHVVALPSIVRFVLVILAADAVEYISHRAYHEVPWLWRIHAVHHSPEHMDWLSGSRLHFFEPLATRALVLVPIVLLGFPQDTIFAYLIFISVQSVLIHSNIKMDVGWLRYVIVTPQFHHWHHASDAEAIDKNYAAHTPLFDMLGRTWHLPKDRWPVKYGTVKPIPGGMLGQFAHPFIGPVKEFLEHRDP